MTTHPAQSERDALREGGEPAAATGRDAWCMPGPDGFAACALSGAECTVAEARRFTRTTLEAWRMCPHLADNAVLVVSELVSNALRHGAADPLDMGFNFLSEERFCHAWLALTRQERGVLCAVSDGGTRAPVLRPQEALAESGRGLHLVNQLSDSWGWTPPDHSGKTVWATVMSRG
ncbi:MULTISPECIES: ATP-binding protein [unclassified Streptomyces]|uniref:ATP-binding protein n=1 Tax=unclassified Streptomyces TaxID=2593676 RepID=UPI00037591B4|nr:MULTISPECIES: ATP-binding protein [unclassified Streptomyces]MYT30043.1 ATP-binding protein [Streptomyces sp. SID8354]